MAKEQEIDVQLPLVSNSDFMSANCVAGQAALSIDHILESILSNLTISDLTQTRLLSQRFNHFSCRKFESVLEIRLQIGSIYPPEDCSIVAPRSSWLRSRGTMEDFILTLSTANRFPCDNFRLYTANILDQRLQSFFALQGCYIHTLSLQLIHICPLEILSQLTYLIMEASPNLQNLALHIDGDFYNPGNDILLKLPNKEWLLPNLKSLSVLSATDQIFELLMNAAVNLLKYNVQNDHFLSYFTKHPGSSRLHLLRDLYLQFYAAEKYLRRLELITGLLATKVEFQIRALRLKFDSEIRDRQDFFPRVILILNNIINNVSETVEEMHLEPLRFLNGIQMPVFQKVLQLVLEDAIGMPSVVYIRCIEEYFPADFIDLSRMFPILKFIVVHKHLFAPTQYIASFSSDVNSLVWKPVVKSYEDFNDILKYKFRFSQVFERNS